VASALSRSFQQKDNDFLEHEWFHVGEPVGIWLKRQLSKRGAAVHSLHSASAGSLTMRRWIVAIVVLCVAPLAFAKP
jgi:hypothetical protein